MINPIPIPIDLFIFDFDGTLADSLPAAIEAVQAMIAELGFPYKSKEEIRLHIGFGEYPLIAGSIDSNDPDKVKAAQEVYYKYVLENLKDVSLFPHTKEILEFIKDRTKIVLSNKKDEFIKLILENHHLLNYFTEILGGDTVPCLKPDPGAINEILRKYKVPPQRTLFIGDMVVDIETGKNAGILTCGVTYGFDGCEKLEKAQPDFLLDDILELKNYVKHPTGRG